MAISNKPAYDGPRGRERAGETVDSHFSGASHQGFVGGTPAIREAVARFNADRKAGKDTAADMAAVVKEQRANAAKFGMAESAVNRLSRLESEQKSGADLNAKQQAVEDRLKSVADAAKSAPKPSKTTIPTGSILPEQTGGWTSSPNEMQFKSPGPAKQV